MPKVVSAVLSVLAVFVVLGCGGDDDSGNGGDGNGQPPAAEESEGGGDQPNAEKDQAAV